MDFDRAGDSVLVETALGHLEIFIEIIKVWSILNYQLRFLRHSQMIHCSESNLWKNHGHGILPLLGVELGVVEHLGVEAGVGKVQ